MDTDHIREDIRKVLKRVAPDILSIPHVLGVDVGPKIVHGLETDELAIRVKVAVKLPPDELPKEYFIPPSIEGYRVDVVEERSDLANAVLRASTYDQLSRGSLERPLDQPGQLETPDIPDRFQSFVDLLLKGWLAVTILSSAVALLLILVTIWSVASRNVAFTTASGGATLIDLIAMAVLRPWEKYQRALQDERVIRKASGVLDAQLEDLRESKLPPEEKNRLRSQYMSSWVKAVDRN